MPSCVMTAATGGSVADGPFTSYGFQSIPGNPSTTTRTLPDRLVDIVNVKDFGAVGNGIADDTAAITEAIDYAWQYPFANLFGQGVIVYFPPGTYLISNPPLFLDRDPLTKAPLPTPVLSLRIVRSRMALIC